MGRMADSRAERRWSKDPRMATTRSVMVWLFWRDSLMNDALSVRVSISKGTPISLTFFFLLFQISSFFFFQGRRRREEKRICGGLLERKVRAYYGFRQFSKLSEAASPARQAYGIFAPRFSGPDENSAD